MGAINRLHGPDVQIQAYFRLDDTISGVNQAWFPA